VITLAAVESPVGSIDMVESGLAYAGRCDIGVVYMIHSHRHNRMLAQDQAVQCAAVKPTSAVVIVSTCAAEATNVGPDDMVEAGLTYVGQCDAGTVHTDIGYIPNVTTACWTNY
jgi:hypothetical protein